MNDVLEATRPVSVGIARDTDPAEEDAADGGDGRLARTLIAESPGGFDLTHKLCELLLRQRFGAALLLARHQRANAIAHPAIYLAEALGGFLGGDPAAMERGRAALRAMLDAMGPTQQATFHTLLIEPIVPRLLSRSFYGGDAAATLDLLDIVTAATPRLRAIFDRSAAAAPLDLERMRRDGADRARLVIMPPPPSGPRQPRRVAVALRDLVFPQQPGSRPHEVGPRLVAAMNRYGWSALPCPIACASAQQDYHAIEAFCERERPDLLLLDDQMIEAGHARQSRADMLGRLRRMWPGIQVVGVHLDAWSLAPDLLRQAAADVDVIWSMCPTQAVWRDWPLASKCLFAPFPHGRTPYGPHPPLRPRPLFSGAVKGYNWHRAFWLTLAESAGLPIEARLGHHAADGLPAVDSSALYLRELADATCAINFSMRPDLSRIVTGRSFETCLSGALLVQETTPDLDHYLVAGEHYLEFSSFADLRAIARFLREHPDEAEAVRRRGHEHARDKYDDISVIASLDRRLRSAAAAAGPTP